MKDEKRFKAYKFFFIILSLYKQFICKRQVTQCMNRSLLNFFSKNAALKTIIIPLSTVFTRTSTGGLLNPPNAVLI